MQIAKLAPVDVGVVRWRTDRQHVTVVVKATFALGDDGPMGMAEVPVPLDPGPPRGGPCSDFVPDKVGVDIVLQGAVHAARAARKIPFGIRVGHLARDLVAVSEQAMRAIPLADGHVLNGDAPDALPTSVSARAVRNDLWQHAALGETFDYTRFNAAPPAQRIEQLAAHTPIVLTNLLADAPLRRVWVPGVQPCVFHADGHNARHVERVLLRCDTLVLDTERVCCSICWRGRLPNTRGDDGEHLIVSFESADAPLQWAEVRDAMRSASWEAAREVSDWVPVDTTRPIARNEANEDDDEATRVRSRDSEVTVPEERAMVTAPIALSTKPQSLPFRAAESPASAPPRQPLLSETVPEFPAIAVEASSERVTAPVDRFTTKVLDGAPLAGVTLPFRAAHSPVDAHPSADVHPSAAAPPSTNPQPSTVPRPSTDPQPSTVPRPSASASPITAAPALPPLHLQFAAALDAGDDDEPLVDPLDRLSGTKPYVQRGTPAAPLPFTPAPDGANVPPGSALAALPSRDGQVRATQLMGMVPDDGALPFDGPRPTPRKLPPAVAPAQIGAPATSAQIGVPATPAPPAIIAHDPLAEGRPPAAVPEAQHAPSDKPTPAPASPLPREPLAEPAAPASTPPIEALPIERYIAVKADLYDETRSLAEVLDQHSIDGPVWRASEQQISKRVASELAKGEHAFARGLRESIAKRRAAAAGHVASEDGQLSVEEYAMVRAEVEESADAVVALEEMAISGECWARWRREWSQRCLRDRALARRFTTELAWARKAIRSTAVD